MNMNAMADIDNETHAYVKDVALPKNTELAHFRILSKIGQNDRGITYLAHDKKSDKQVVIKESLPFFCAFRDVNTLQVEAMGFDGAAQYYAQITKHFVRTAHALKRANHPNLVPVLEVFEAYGTAYYVMPYLNGQTLYHNAPAVVDEEWLKPILKHLLGALDHLHAKKLLHLNVAPSNILMHEEATPTLISYSITPPQKMEISITMRMAPGYIPIEQMSPDDKCGSWTDLYALGATCYRFITGERPPEALDRIVDATTCPPLSERAELHGRFSHHFLKCVDKAMALRAQHRWQSSQEWLSAMENPQFFTEEPAAPKRSKWAPWLLTTAVLGLSLGGFFYAAPFTAPSPSAVAHAYKPAKPQAALTGLPSRATLGDTGRSVVVTTEQVASHNKQASSGATKTDSPLHEATGSPEQLKLLLQAGADVNATDSIGESALSKAVKEGNIDSVKLLLAAPGIDVNKGMDNFSPLLRACVDNRVEIVKLLLAAPGIDVNLSPENNFSPLIWAIIKGNTACAELLLAAPGIDINRANNMGDTPLCLAAQLGHTKLVRLILSKPDIDFNKTHCTNATPLMLAAERGHTACVKLLLAMPGININQANRDYADTALSVAVSGGHAECVKLLLAAQGIDINHTNKKGETALHLAAKHNRAECLKLLLAAPGIDINKTATNGDTPLSTALEREHTDCAELLRAAGGKQ